MPKAERFGHFFRRAASNRAPCRSPEASPAEIKSFKKTQLNQRKAAARRFARIRRPHASPAGLSLKTALLGYSRLGLQAEREKQA